MESRYLSFQEDDHYEGKTKRFYVCSKTKIAVLGEIGWWGPWRQYVFFPEGGTCYNRECMKDICAFIDGLMEKRKAAKVADQITNKEGDDL